LLVLVVVYVCSFVLLPEAKEMNPIPMAPGDLFGDGGERDSERCQRGFYFHGVDCSWFM
jgi:hypothetical protein